MMCEYSMNVTKQQEYAYIYYSNYHGPLNMYVVRRSDHGCGYCRPVAYVQ